MVSGTLRMVRMLEVTSSPVWPSPRVMPVDEARAAVFGRLVVQRHAQAVELEFGNVLDGKSFRPARARERSQAASSSAE